MENDMIDGLNNKTKLTWNENVKYMRPFLCPVCKGKGFLPAGFYNLMFTDTNSSITYTEQCKTCDGIGLVWSEPIEEEEL